MPDLSSLANRLPPGFTTRFAPAPTGYLHLGHAANALAVWGIARALGGRVLLRVEDHDRTRSRPEYEAALLEDLEWLGFIPDGEVPRQSERNAAYAAALARLADGGRVYVCDCSRRDLARDVPDVFGAESRYPGRCRTRGLAPELTPSRRIRMDPGEECFDDAWLGKQCQSPGDQCGDVLARDRRGNWSYQFAVSVDDFEQGIDLVIRGADLLESTARQMRIARLLGRPAPAIFGHHPLITKPTGAKLSKSNGDSGIRDLRNAGRTAQEVLGMAAELCRLAPAGRPITASHSADLFRQ